MPGGTDGFARRALPPWLYWRRARHVLGINARNLLYVNRLNRRRNVPAADDKVLTKRLLQAAGVPTPATLAILTTMMEVSHSRGALIGAGEFVVKPAMGRKGGGILVITEFRPDAEGGRFIRAGGAALPWDDLRRGMADILFGVHSSGRNDTVLIERRVRAHASLGGAAEFGLPDVRVILLRGEPAMAMMRVPTRASEGRANLHQGALGVALRLRDGFATRCMLYGEPIDRHPDNDAPMTGFALHDWQRVLQVARLAAGALPLGYVGVDIVLDTASGPVVMEVNARPGLEIQNVNGAGLRRRLARIASGWRPAR